MLLLVYTTHLLFLLYHRLHHLYSTTWISLTPFNLYTDIRDAILATIRFIRIKFTLLRTWLSVKVYTPVSTRVVAGVRWVVDRVGRVGRWVGRVIRIGVDKVKAMGKMVVDKVAAPLYMYCVGKLVAIRKIVCMVFNATRKLFLLLLSFIKGLIVSFY